MRWFLLHLRFRCSHLRNPPIHLSASHCTWQPPGYDNWRVDMATAIQVDQNLVLKLMVTWGSPILRTPHMIHMYRKNRDTTCNYVYSKYM